MAIRTGFFGYTFTALRIIEIALMGVICGCSAAMIRHVSRAEAPRQPPAALAAVIVSVIGGVYLLTTLLLHVFGVVIRYIISTILDIVLLIGLIVVAVLIGRPLTGLSCSTVRRFNNNLRDLDDALYGYKPTADHTFMPQQQYFSLPNNYPSLGGVQGLPALGATAKEIGRKLGDYDQWVGRSFYWCRLMKVVWGCAIAGCILMVVSAFVAWRIWRKVNGIPWLREEVDDYEDGVQDGVSVQEEVVGERPEPSSLGVGGGGGGRREMRERERRERFAEEGESV
ncbi:hypothetical protein BJ508DRAFT_141981 [Ascobolus immersus RN42]|uniref:MARVEL domain-containing protein n=1 Tax=Ascobolus immersus RN42 TaxID=1160509 RepID=A0A3N4HZN3_ASCIM|nr:hypothetical protein BJ508DRAFT_141981 [Ascobolus immersus RN42]